MACNTETKQIGDHEYSVTQWPADKAILMKMKLAKTFGASIGLIASVALESTKKKVSEAEEAKALSEGISTLFQSNTPEEVTDLIKKCVIGVAMDGTKITETSFNQIFSGDELMDVYKVFMFVIKVNYGNLLKGQKAEALLAKVQGSL